MKDKVKTKQNWEIRCLKTGGTVEEERLTVGHCPEPLFLELKHLIGEAHSFLADEVLTGNANVIEEHFSCV